MKLTDLKSYNYLKQKDSSLCEQVQKVFDLVKDPINSIAGRFNNYTMHDMNHGLRVAAYMEKMAFGLNCTEEQEINKFSPLELALLILSAILHDIGMIVRPQDEVDIKNNNIKYANNITFDGVLKYTKNEKEAINEIIRITHAPRIHDFVFYDFENGENIANILKVKNLYSYADDVIKICRAHGEDYNYIKNELKSDCTKGIYSFNQQYIAVLLRIADYIDLDRQRTPIMWYSMMEIEGFSKTEWEKHFQIHNDEKFKKYMDGKMQIYFDGESSDAKIHRKYLKYVDDLKLELEKADELLNTEYTKEKYKLNLTTKIDDRVNTKGFKYSDLRLILDYQSITELLMGKNIYGDYRLGLRELIQNSIDACKLAIELREKEEGYPIPGIFIKYSKQHNYVIIKDTGVGMTLDIIKNHFLNVGKSYYKSREYQSTNYKYEPIGQYGIGFLACFLLSNNVKIKTRHISSNRAFTIELEKNSEFVVTKEEDTTLFYGTEIELEYSSFFDVFVNETILKMFLEKYFLTDISIQVKNVDENQTYNVENQVLNDMNNVYQKRRGEWKIEELDCSQYSDFVKGNIYINYPNLKRRKALTSFKNDKIYLYDSEEQKFQKVSELKNGFYRMFKYTQISNDNYEQIINKKSTDEKKVDEIKALGFKHGVRMYMLIRREDYFPFNNWRKANNSILVEIFKKSQLDYYPQFNFREVTDHIFIYNNQYLELTMISAEPMPFLENIHDKDMSLLLYCKDIYVQEIFYYEYIGLSEYNIFGLIRCDSNEIKLDVSRNNLIKGEKLIKKELSKILLMHHMQTEKNNIINEAYKEMIKYIK